MHQILQGRETRVIRLVEHAYRLHGTNAAVNPPSYFLRIPDKPDARIIALPASVRGDIQADGIKWISSFPGNIESGLPRASAVLILNDSRNGYPIACLEASIISACRTAASAALAADLLTRDRSRPTTVGFFGTGLIARYVHAYLTAAEWTFAEVGLFDLEERHAASFAQSLEEQGTGGAVTVHSSPEELVKSADLLIFATVAPAPHIDDRSWFSHHPVVLHLSLRDLAPDVILSAFNVVDDIAHCLNANTSVHLAEQLTDGRQFLAGTLYDIMTGAVSVPASQTVIFSPFGLGLLDITVGKYVYDEVRRQGDLTPVNDFFFDLDRHRPPAVR